MNPIIRKAKVVMGANILLRNATTDDAEFILSLRLDPIKSLYLSATSSKLEDQINWLRLYEDKADQAYFIICNKEMNKLGCIRMYDATDDSYFWGSWLMISGLSPLISIESALLIFAYGEYLGFKNARIDVRKDNKFIWNFHEKFLFAERIGENDIDIFYVVKQELIQRSLAKYSNLLTNPLLVSHCFDGGESIEL